MCCEQAGLSVAGLEPSDQQPSEQFYPPLRHQQATPPPEPVERASRRPHQPARRPGAQADTETKAIRIISERGLVPSPTKTSEGRGDIKQMRPARQKIRSPGSFGRRLNNTKIGEVALALNSPALVSEDVMVGVTPLVDDMGSLLPEVVSPMVAEGVPLADLVDEVVTMWECLPWLSPKGALVWRPWSLLRWRPRPTLLGWRPRPTLLG